MNAILLGVALLVPGYGEKDTVARIEKARGRVLESPDGYLSFSIPIARTPPCETCDGLKELTWLTNLEYLVLDGTAVPEVGVARLQKALPKCEVIQLADQTAR